MAESSLSVEEIRLVLSLRDGMTPALRRVQAATQHTLASMRAVSTGAATMGAGVGRGAGLAAGGLSGLAAPARAVSGALGQVGTVAGSAETALGGLGGGLSGAVTAAASASTGLRTLGLRMAGVANRARLLGQQMGVASLAVGAAMAGVVGTFLRFEWAMNRTAAVSGATAAEWSEMTRLAQELGATTEHTASKAAEGMTFLAMAGFNARETMAAIPGVLDLSSAGAIDLARAADITSNVLKGYGIEVERLGHVNDVLAATFTASNTNLEQLGDAMAYVAPVARTAGLAFEETSAAIGILGNAGIQASMAGTALRRAITRLLKPTDAAQRILDEVGLEITDAEGRMRPLSEIIDHLGPIAGDTAKMVELFGLRSLAAMNVLSQEGGDALRGFEAQLANSGGLAREIADRQLSGLTGVWIRLKSAMEGLAIAIGERLSPALSALLTRVYAVVQRLRTEWVPLWDALPAGMQQTVLALGALAAAAAPLLVLLGTLGLAGGALTAALSTLGGGLAAVGGVVASAAASVTGLGSALAALAVPAAAAALGALKAAGVGLVSVLLTLTGSLAGILPALGAMLPTAIGLAVSGVSTLSVSLSGLMPMLGASAAGVTVLAGRLTALGAVGAALRGGLIAALLALGGVLKAGVLVSLGGLKATVVGLVGALGVVLAPVNLAVAGLVALGTAAAALAVRWAVALARTEEIRALLGALGRLVSESVVWAFRALRDVLAAAWDAVGRFTDAVAGMIPQFVLDAVGWLAEQVDAVADALGRVNAAAEDRRLRDAAGETGEALAAVEARAEAALASVTGLGASVSTLRATDLEAVTAEAEAIRVAFEGAAEAARHVGPVQAPTALLDLEAQIASASEAASAQADLAEATQALTSAYADAGEALTVMQEALDRGEEPVETLRLRYDEVAQAVRTAAARYVDLSREVGVGSEQARAAHEVLAVLRTTLGEVETALTGMEAAARPAADGVDEVDEAAGRVRQTFGGAAGVTHMVRALETGLRDQSVSTAAAQDRLAALRAELAQARARYRDFTLTVGLGSEAAAEARDRLRDAAAAVSAVHEAVAAVDAEALRTLNREIATGTTPQFERAREAAERWAEALRTLEEQARQMGPPVSAAMREAAEQSADAFSRVLVPGLQEAALEGVRVIGEVLTRGGSLRDAAMAGARALARGIGDTITQTIQARLPGPLGQVLGNILGGLAGKFVTWMSEKFGRFFGDPSEAELAGRQAAEAYQAGLAGAASPDQMREALAAGWDSSELAASWIVMRDNVLAAGGSIQEAEALWQRWRDAIPQGEEAVKRVQFEIDEWGRRAEAAGEATAEAARAQEEAARKAEEASRRMTASVVSSYRSIVSSADQAAQEAIQKAEEAGLSEADAAAAGAWAWQQAYDAKKALRITEMAEEAAFAAALKEIQEGNAAGAAEAARKAFAETREAATLAFGAVEQAAAIAQGSVTEDLHGIAVSADEELLKVKEAADTQFGAVAQVAAIAQGSVTEGLHVIAVSADEELLKVKEAADTQFGAVKQAAGIAQGAVTEGLHVIAVSADEELLKVGEAAEIAFGAVEQAAGTMQTDAAADLRAVGETAETELTRVKTAADQQFEGLEEAASRAADEAGGEGRRLRDSLNRYLGEIDRDVAITVTVYRQTVDQGGGAPAHGEGGELPGRARGGPVRAGLPYLVGEHGPEVLVPGLSGAVVPDAARTGAALAQTLGARVLAAVEGAAAGRAAPAVPIPVQAPPAAPRAGARRPDGIDYRRLGEAVAEALRREPPTVAIDGRRIAEATIRHAPRAARRLV